MREKNFVPTYKYFTPRALMSDPLYGRINEDFQIGSAILETYRYSRDCHARHKRNSLKVYRPSFVYFLAIYRRVIYISSDSALRKIDNGCISAVGGEKIMDAPPAAFSSSHRSCKDFQPHHQPLLPF